MKEAGLTQLYRCYATDGALLYVGVSYSTVERFANHRQTGWSGSVGNIKVELFPTRQAALVAELVAIRDEKPRFNIVGVPKPPKSPKSLKPSKISTTVGVRMPNAIHAEVFRIAQCECRSIAWIVNEAVTEYVKRDAQPAKRRKQ